MLYLKERTAAKCPPPPLVLIRPYMSLNASTHVLMLVFSKQLVQGVMRN